MSKVIVAAAGEIEGYSILVGRVAIEKIVCRTGEMYTVRVSFEKVVLKSRQGAGSQANADAETSDNTVSDGNAGLGIDVNSNRGISSVKDVPITVQGNIVISDNDTAIMVLRESQVRRY